MRKFARLFYLHLGASFKQGYGCQMMQLVKARLTDSFNNAHRINDRIDML